MAQLLTLHHEAQNLGLPKHFLDFILEEHPVPKMYQEAKRISEELANKWLIKVIERSSSIEFLCFGFNLNDLPEDVLFAIHKNTSGLEHKLLEVPHIPDKALKKMTKSSSQDIRCKANRILHIRKCKREKIAEMKARVTRTQMVTPSKVNLNVDLSGAKSFFYKLGLATGVLVEEENKKEEING